MRGKEMTLDVSKVWEKINKDPKFAEMPEPARQAIKPLIDALPEIMANVVDKPATVASIAEMKVVFLKAFLTGGYLKAMILAWPDEDLPMDREGLIAITEAVAITEAEMRQTLKVTEEFVKSDIIAGLLKFQGMTDEVVILSPRFGLNAEALELYLDDQLTVGKLIEIQPKFIFKNAE